MFKRLTTKRRCQELLKKMMTMIPMPTRNYGDDAGDKYYRKKGEGPRWRKTLAVTGFQRIVTSVAIFLLTGHWYLSPHHTFSSQLKMVNN